MGGLADQQKEAQDAARGYLRATVGDVLEVAVSELVVNVDGNAITMPNLGSTKPIVGESVRVFYTAEGLFLCAGPVRPRPATGTIQSVAAGVSVDVLGDDGVSYPGIPYNPADTLSAGQLVALDWSANGYVIGRISGVTAGAAPAPPPPPPTPTTGVYEFQAADSGSWYIPNGAWSTNDVWYGINNYGAWFYGTKIRDSLAGTTVVSAEIYLPVLQAYGNANLQLGTHPHPSKPAGAPSVANGVMQPGATSTGWFPLPTSVAQYLVNNAGAGVSTYGPGARLFAGTAKNADSGRLRIAWRR